MTQFRSHTKEEIRRAHKQGKEIWALDTGNFGEDDYLIGSFREVMADICHHYEMEELPPDWSLSKVDWEI